MILWIQILILIIYLQLYGSTLLSLFDNNLFFARSYMISSK